MTRISEGLRRMRCFFHAAKIEWLVLALLSLFLMLTPVEWASSQEDVVIILDPGHGGEDPGVVGPGGSTEKEFCLELARGVKQRIDRDMGYRTFLTRTGDETLSLDERAGAANSLRGTLFVSIHLAGFPDPAFKGYGVFVHDVSDQGSAVRKTRPNPLPLWDEQQVSHLGESRRLGGVLHDQLPALFPSERDFGLQALPIYPLGALDMPAVLIEPAVLTNPGQEKMLKSEASMERISEAIFQGINAYLKGTPDGGGRE